LKSSEFVLLACQEVVFGWKVKCGLTVEPVTGRNFSTNTTQEAVEACRIACDACGYTVKGAALCRWWLD